ncbi:MAG: transposase [Deferrisomatales bacterium]|nr:transposase [Deferrisomatales bacterium]
MPRTARLDVLGVVQHVMARGIEGRPVFRDDRDRHQFMDRLAGITVAGDAQLLAWSLLDNHFHLVLRPRGLHLKDLMRRLMTGYAGWHNRRHSRKGHLFQNRYRSIVVEEEPYLLELVRYVHLNPLRAGLVVGLDALDEFPWTGHAVLLGTHELPCQDIDEVLGRFGMEKPEARRQYRAFVAMGIDEGQREEFRGGGVVRSTGGWDALRRRQPEERELGDPRVLGSGTFVEQLLDEDDTERLRPALTADEVLRETSRTWQVGADEILGPSRQRRVTRARGAFFLCAHRDAGLTITNLARWTGRTAPAVWQAVQRARSAEQDTEKPS